MRIAEQKIKDVKTEVNMITIPAEYDSSGNLVRESYSKEVTMRIPVYEVIYRDAAEEELKEAEERNATVNEVEPTAEERLTILEDAFAELCEEVLS